MRREQLELYINSYLPLREIFRLLGRPNDSYLKLSNFSSESNHRIPSTNFEESEKHEMSEFKELIIVEQNRITKKGKI